MMPVRMKSARAVVCSLTMACCLVAVQVRQSAGAEPAQAANETFEFKDFKLPQTLEAVQKLLPALKKTDDPAAAREGLVCYVATGFKASEKARFYFSGDALYQLELEYSPKQIVDLGNMDGAIRKLVAAFGPADHADIQRRSWESPINPRVDFYIAREPALLVFTRPSVVPNLNVIKDRP